jgi:hypothetical protein
MEVSDYLHITVALHPLKNPSVPFNFEARQTPEPHLLYRQREEVLPLPGMKLVLS